MEIAQEIVDDGFETFKKQHIPPSEKSKKYNTFLGPINANCTKFHHL
jgi:hypothetical protein